MTVPAETSQETARRAGLVAGLMALSWLGEVVHNAIELPDLTLLSPENSIPALISVALFVGWWRLRNNRLAVVLIIIWTLLHLIVGAIVTVIPFRFLPFYPEQTLRHYGAHVVYGVAQLPLLAVMFRQWRGARA